MEEMKWHVGFKQRRELHQISLSMMAKLLEVNGEYLREFEKGNCNLNIEQLEKACLLFGCQLSKLSQTDDTDSFDAKDFSLETLESIIRTRQLAVRLHFVEIA